MRDAESKKKIGGWYLDAWNRTYGQIDVECGRLPDSMARVYGAAEHLAHHLSEAPVMIFVCLRDASPGGCPQADRYGSIYPRRRYHVDTGTRPYPPVPVGENLHSLGFVRVRAVGILQ